MFGAIRGQYTFFQFPTLCGRPDRHGLAQENNTVPGYQSDAHGLGLFFAIRRAQYLGRLLQRRPAQAVFALGQINRVMAFVDREARRSG